MKNILAQFSWINSEGKIEIKYPPIYRCIANHQVSLKGE